MSDYNGETSENDNNTAQGSDSSDTSYYDLENFKGLIQEYDSATVNDILSQIYQDQNVSTTLLKQEWHQNILRDMVGDISSMHIINQEETIADSEVIPKVEPFPLNTIIVSTPSSPPPPFPFTFIENESLDNDHPAHTPQPHNNFLWTPIFLPPPSCIRIMHAPILYFNMYIIIPNIANENAVVSNDDPKFQATKSNSSDNNSFTTCSITDDDTYFTENDQSSFTNNDQSSYTTDNNCSLAIVDSNSTYPYSSTNDYEDNHSYDSVKID